MRTPIGAFIIVVIMLLLDWYVLTALKTVSNGASPKARGILFAIYGTLSLLAIVGFLVFIFTGPEFLPKRIRIYLFATAMGLLLAQFAASIFFLVDDLRRLLQWGAGKLFFNNTEGSQMNDDGISRSVFLSWLGIAAGGTLFGSLIYGFSNKYNYQVKRVKLSFPNLPEGFNGLRIVHFSDVHSGSLTNHHAVAKGVEKIIKENADLIVFSGDLVNDRATEMQEFMDLFSTIKAPMGVYSTFGNHDYGDYVSWPINGVSKEQNLKDLAKVHAELGWNLLMNEHVVLKRGVDEIALLGIENWSAKARFPKYGKMDKAYAGSESYPFKISYKSFLAT